MQCRAFASENRERQKEPQEIVNCDLFALPRMIDWFKAQDAGFQYEHNE